MIIALSLTLTACGGKPETQTPNKPAEQTSAAGAINWPSEFKAWGVPVLQKGTLTVANNKSVSGQMITQGVNAIVNLKDVSKADFAAYCKEVETAGFVKSNESLADVLLVYQKNISGGIIKLTLSHDNNVATIIANNSAAPQNAAATGKVQWPDTVKFIPAFTKGKYKETVDMGGGMYAVTFTGITDADLTEYRNVLKKAGFQHQKDEETEGYMAINNGNAYSVGFVRSGNDLQIVALKTPM